MDTSKLKKFAQYARRTLQEQVENRLNRVLEQDSVARRENPQTIEELEKQISLTSQDQVVEKAAYTWFNRFCALRFMDVNGYTSRRVVSPESGQFQPGILAEAKMGDFDNNMTPEITQQQVSALLSGAAASRNPQAEAYRLLLVAVCNAYHRSMPYLFERIADYTELLIPDDLLSGNAILSYVQQAMTPEACKDVEIIGWLYQFYISEKKDEVFEGLKKNKKVTPENIPAATQLFTPHYIVRYLVENSLGRLWMLNHPDSRLIEKMDYYIKPVEVETDFLKVAKPEDLKICDPACGSGHMLSYAYDLLYAIYEEQGYADSDIPANILTHNLYGIELDERAGELASFALSMKAAGGNPSESRSSHKRFFRKPMEPNICILKNVDLQASELKDYMDFAGRDLFSPELQTTLRQFDEADNFGSLIRPTCGDVAEVRGKLEAKSQEVPLLLGEIHKDVLIALKQADFLSPKYHVVVANPPYMGGKGMNPRLKKYAADHYKNSKSDLFAMFIERCLELVQKQGQVGMITMQSWMFLSSFEHLRKNLLLNNSIMAMAHLGARAFDSIGGEVVSTTAFIFGKSLLESHQGTFLRLVDTSSENEKSLQMLKAAKSKNGEGIYTASTSDFASISGSPISYWASAGVKHVFANSKNLRSLGKTGKGSDTGKNELFIRGWQEVSLDKIGFDCSSTSDTHHNKKKFYPTHKGGGFRRWYGNRADVINWQNDGESIRNYSVGTIRNHAYYFKQCISWGKITTSKLSVRDIPAGSIADDAGPSAFLKEHNSIILGFLNSCVADNLLSFLSPTLNFQVGDINSLPVLEYCLKPNSRHINAIKDAVDLAQKDWDSYELSWEFSSNPLATKNSPSQLLEDRYNQLLHDWALDTRALKYLEQENNQFFIDAYGLKEELSFEVPTNEITLHCNPSYRYGNGKPKVKLDALLKADTIREFISYAVGCMFGRYSLDKPGLILANQGDTLENYLKQIPQPSFMPDKENVIPILEDSWFTDDIVDRFRLFLKTTFGEEHFEENLLFIEKAIGKDIRKFFVKDFYTDHLKRYKKRPIYWLFSSPKGTFNTLIYLHRYHPDTASVVLNDYLREFNTKLGEEKKRQEQINISASTSAGEKTKALKQINKLNKMIDDLDEYERDILFPLATEQVEIDLDDGVKHNYKLFGKALKKVVGLS
ncbi:hypothetical protein CI610_01784 [invertebrate metagenome]|uniref:site-specific DNA-methyltransferase (adenine-specific) n=1 Tax=invertebrate metagenome TaxID=1711999 RepID=A0A2H9T7S5_9ZZZZ